MAFDSVVRKPAYSQVADQIREAIFDGELAPDSILPSERELSITFSVGRTTVREALRALEAQGLVVSAGPTAPFRIAAPEALSKGPVRQALQQMLRLRHISLRDLVEVRAALESAAVSYAANRDPDLEEARAALAEMKEGEVDVKTFEEADVRFHIALVAASGNTGMALIMLAVRDSIAAHLLSSLADEPDPAATVRRLTAEHAEILKAVEAGEGERAADLVTAHIVDFYGSRQVPSRPH